MTIQEIISIEMNGLIDTINDYSMEHYIHNYTKQLKSYHLPEDKQNMTLVVERLINWYETHLSDINDNKYIYNKHEHQKSYEILQELCSLLKKGD